MGFTPQQLWLGIFGIYLVCVCVCVFFIPLFNITFSAFTRHSLINVDLTPKSSAQTGLNILGHGMDFLMISFLTFCPCFIFSFRLKGFPLVAVSGGVWVVEAGKVGAELFSSLTQASSFINCQSEIWTKFRNLDNKK